MRGIMRQRRASCEVWACDDERCNGHEMGLEQWGIHELYRKLTNDPQRDKKTVDAIFKRAAFFNPLLIETASLQKSGGAADESNLSANQEEAGGDYYRDHDQRDDARQP